MSWTITGTQKFSPLWTPANTTTSLWLDASDASTITQSGGLVSQWNDKSGNNRHGTQSVSANRPAYLANWLNGLPGLDFDGINDELLLSSLTALSSVNQTFFIVAQRDNAGGRTEIAFAIGNDSSSDGLADIPRWTDNVMYSQLGYAANRPTPTSVITNTPYINCVTGGTKQVSYTNDTLIGTGTTQSTATFGNTSGAVGSGRAISSAIRYFDGKIGELIIVPSVATTALRQQVTGYFAHRWGLTANLPAGHPYKTAPPYA